NDFHAGAQPHVDLLSEVFTRIIGGAHFQNHVRNNRYVLLRDRGADAILANEGPIRRSHRIRVHMNLESRFSGKHFAKIIVKHERARASSYSLDLASVFTSRWWTHGNQLSSN